MSMTSASDPPPLQVSGLWLERGGREVLRGIDLVFERGAVTSVVGPSGAGKSSLLRCLNRLEEVHAGEVTFNGRDVRTIDPTSLRRRVGMIFQTPLIFDGGVRANLVYGLDDHVSDDALSEALTAASLPPEFLERESAALSVGQAQRVCIARALVRGPEVLLMDEPTSALDVRASARIESLIGSLVERGLTVVLVTHDIGQATRVAQRAALLVDGRITATGSPEEVSKAWPEE